ncbi:glycoside hydrolase family 43 protein [Deinococcus roseus]|uniref:Glycosyl hydrolase family 43 n=1 Tax=Deinococcus roseus TaxID=392414 RepID=A0ABQ2D281_9DEIO|nr:glycoside hydrolase family 43 protein [Deinococcus roseus]GGJ42765.1 glycosyl hydrolase family 43 [Deinococcus roseus]
MPSRIVLLFTHLLLALVLGFSSAQQAKTFSNPVLSSAGADPHIVFHEGFYYMTYTTGADIRFRKAASLAGLDQAEAVQVFQPTGDGCCNVWAPEFHLLDGPNGKHWYLYYTAGPEKCCSEQRMYVAESASTDPMGPYTLKGKVFDAQHDFWSIDASILKAEGKLYLIYSGTPQDHMPYEKPQNIYIASMENPWTLSSERSEISTPSLFWEMQGAAVNEGPVVLYHNDDLFLAFSGSGCWTDDYKLGLLKANVHANLLDPASWMKLPDPVLTRSDANQAFGPGHNGFFKSPDGTEDWVVYHANAFPGQQCGGARLARAQKITWGADGLPIFGTPDPLWVDVPLPSGDPGLP